MAVSNSSFNAPHSSAQYLQMERVGIEEERLMRRKLTNPAPAAAARPVRSQRVTQRLSPPASSTKADEWNSERDNAKNRRGSNAGRPNGEHLIRAGFCYKANSGLRE